MDLAEKRDREIGTESYDVIVVGAGHAGVEAAMAAAKLGVKTALFTLSLDAVANLPCNPSIGGTAKGHLVREIDALGGMMGQFADATMLQSRMLNRGKGPAVHSLRVQTDRQAYHALVKHTLENTENCYLKQEEIVDVLVENDRVQGVVGKLGMLYPARAVVIATGTYLNGKISIGEVQYSGGPDGIAAPMQLGEHLAEKGLKLQRFKTGTPARVHRRSVDFSRCKVQKGDADIEAFSFNNTRQLTNKVDCYISYTNEKTHEIIRKNLHRSPMYAGKIEGVGPRYCPSIEDKVVRFAEKERHQLFIEPCGLDTEELYLQGMSTSLPLEVQMELYRSIAGLERVEILRPAYAIEYDCMDPTGLEPTLECKAVRGLYGAGQFNGTSGYEEAAAQGLLAGINAAKSCKNEEQVILERQESYMGTLVDDLVTKGVSDPYRMMTSRSEVRLYLRQDNADTRLMPVGRKVGLIDDVRWLAFGVSEEKREKEIKRVRETSISPKRWTEEVRAKAGQGVESGIFAGELLRRPGIRYADIVQLIGPGEAVDERVSQRVEIEIKYEGYIRRQLRQVDAMKKMEGKEISPLIEYGKIQSLSLEAREKLGRIQPRSLGQAARIPGVSPSDVSQLAVFLVSERKARGNDKADVEKTETNTTE